MHEQILSWLVTGIGILGFNLVGKKVWWSWYINLGCQTLWFAYAIVTSTPAFAVAASFYTVIFSLNAYRWTKEHISKKKEVIGNLSENRNRRRSPVHRGARKWYEPRYVGKQSRKADGGSRRMAKRDPRHKHDDSRASKAKDVRLP